MRVDAPANVTPQQVDAPKTSSTGQGFGHTVHKVLTNKLLLVSLAIAGLAAVGVLTGGAGFVALAAVGATGGVLALGTVGAGAIGIIAPIGLALKILTSKENKTEKAIEEDESYIRGNTRHRPHNDPVPSNRAPARGGNDRWNTD